MNAIGTFIKLLRSMTARGRLDAFVQTALIAKETTAAAVGRKHGITRAQMSAGTRGACSLAPRVQRAIEMELSVDLKPLIADTKTEKGEL